MKKYPVSWSGGACFVASLGALIILSSAPLEAKGKKPSIFNLNELGAAKDKFEAHQKSTVGGSDYYTDQNKLLRLKHVAIYAALVNSVVVDRLTQQRATLLVNRLLDVGEQAKRARGNKDGLNAGQARRFHKHLDVLQADVRKSRAVKIDKALLTPKINRMQWMQEEVYRYAEESGELSKGKTKALRRKMNALQKLEEKAKKDKKVTDKERVKLHKEAVDVWKAFVEALTR